MSIELSTIPPDIKAAELICELRNDPYILQMSSHSRKRRLADFFHSEFMDRYVTSIANHSYFILYNGKRIGVFALERTKRADYQCREVSIFLAEKYRFRGIGKKALQQGIQLAKKIGLQRLIANIKEENIPSQKLFAAAQFIKDKESWELTLYPKQKVQIIAEIGSNFKSTSPEEDLACAIKMIRLAKSAGADFVKFQLFTPSKLYSKNAGKAKYLDRKISLEMDTLFEKIRLDTKLLPILKKTCAELEIGFLASSFSEADFITLDPFVSMHKIASYEITHTKLIILAAKSRKPLLLSTGGATLEEIGYAVDLFHKEGGKNLTLLQCTAQYPADPEAMNLAVIQQLNSRFEVPCGLSDHSEDPVTAAVMAVTMGATVIEKHFTLNRMREGPDHFFAIEPIELKEMVKKIRLAEEMRLSADKQILTQEEDLAEFAKRGLQATAKILKGDSFVFQKNIDILRPGNNAMGLHPKYTEAVEGRKASSNIEEGQGILMEDVIW